VKLAFIKIKKFNAILVNETSAPYASIGPLNFH